MVGHEDSGTTFGAGALALQSLDLVGAGVDLVVLKDGQLDLLVGVLNLLGLGVGLLLLLLSSTLESKRKLNNGELFNSGLRESASISKKSGGGDKALLLAGDTWKERG